jgi:hypothetical protein
MFMSMAQADGPFRKTHLLGYSPGISMQTQERLSGRPIVNFDLFPAHHANACPQRFRHSFLGRKSRRQRWREAACFDELARREEPFEESFTMPKDGPIDSVDLHNIHAALEHLLSLPDPSMPADFQTHFFLLQTAEVGEGSADA